MAHLVGDGVGLEERGRKEVYTYISIGVEHLVGDGVGLEERWFRSSHSVSYGVRCQASGLRSQISALRSRVSV